MSMKLIYSLWHVYPNYAQCLIDGGLMSNRQRPATDKDSTLTQTWHISNILWTVWVRQRSKCSVFMTDSCLPPSLKHSLHPCFPQSFHPQNDPCFHPWNHPCFHVSILASIHIPIHGSREKKYGNMDISMESMDGSMDIPMERSINLNMYPWMEAWIEVYHQEFHMRLVNPHAISISTWH